MLKKILIQILPPIFVKFLKLFRISTKPIKNSIQNGPSNQSLDIYYDSKMASILEKWGERNAWIEIQHLLYDKKGKILDVACGTGKVIEILNKISIKDVYGCDISDYS